MIQNGIIINGVAYEFAQREVIEGDDCMEYECTSFATKMKTIIGNLYELKDGTLKDKIYGTK